MKSILIIGLGRFGKALAQELQRLGNEVMVVDKDESLINELAPIFHDAQVVDCCSDVAIQSLGVDAFDACFVTASGSFETQIRTTALLHKHGAKHIVVKASGSIETEILKKVGADEIIEPEKIVAGKLAVQFNNHNIFDFVVLSDEYALYETSIPSSWAGKTVADIDVRKKYHINIIVVKKGDVLNTTPGPDYIFEAQDHIMFIGTEDTAQKLTK